jgi:hypothetical protein
LRAVIVELETFFQELELVFLLPSLLEISPEREDVSHKEEHEIDKEAVQLYEFQSNVDPRGDVPISVVQLLPIQVLTAHIVPVVRMEPIRLLIACPLSVIEVLDGPRLVVCPVSGGILIHCLLSAHIIIADPVFYVVCLSGYGIGEDLVGLEYFLEHLSSLILILPLARIEVRMVLFRQLIVGELNILG